MIIIVQQITLIPIIKIIPLLRLLFIIPLLTVLPIQIIRALILSQVTYITVIRAASLTALYRPYRTLAFILDSFLYDSLLLFLIIQSPIQVVNAIGFSCTEVAI